MVDFFTGYIRTIEHLFTSDTIANGNYDFDLDARGPKNNVVEYFTFIDAQGDQVDAGAGTVVIQISSGEDIFQDIVDGAFNAADARLATRTKPNGYGRADRLRVTLAGVTVAAGFRLFVTQNVS